jgi:hypothetical protein
MVLNMKRIHYLAFSRNPLFEKNIKQANVKLCDSIYSGLGIFLLRFIKHIGIGLLNVNKIISKSKEVLFIVGSNNQYNSLKDIQFKMSDSSSFVSFASPTTSKVAIIFPLAIAYFIALLLSPIAAIVFFRFEKKDRQMIKCILPEYLLSFGLSVSLALFLKWRKPKVLVISNDHNFNSRLANFIARRQGIKTVYVQHATVGDDFPKLEFDLALLEGEDAQNKYLAKGSDKSKIKLIGMPKFDAYLEYKKTNTKMKAIGIGLSIFDDIEIVQGVLRRIKETFPGITLFIRPHPADKRYAGFSETAINEGVKISDSRGTNIFEFLDLVDVVLAGDTSLHLEATLMNVNSIYFKMSTNEYSDYYGYVKNKLVRKAGSFDKLQKILTELATNIPDVKNKAKYYNNVLGTANEGSSTELAAESIRLLARNSG